MSIERNAALQAEIAQAVDTYREIVDRTPTMSLEGAYEAHKSANTPLYQQVMADIEKIHTDSDAAFNQQIIDVLMYIPRKSAQTAMFIPRTIVGAISTAIKQVRRK